jgi:diguanylate cyclase (GGDEF)-like protein
LVFEVSLDGAQTQQKVGVGRAQAEPRGMLAARDGPSPGICARPGRERIVAYPSMYFLADTATWVGVGVAVGAALVALVASAVLLVIVLRRPAKEQLPALPVGRGAPEAAERALVEARVESERSRRLSDIATTIDLDAVLERTLEAAVSTDGVDAAMTVIRQNEEEPLVATLGMTSEEAARQPVSSSPSGSGARAVRISYRYDEAGDPEPGGPLIRGGVAVPLREEHVGTVGTLAVFWRKGDRVLADEDIADLEALARTSAPAIRNAQEFREARQLADVDALTGIHNRRYFYETLERECARAHRYERGIALIILDVDNFKATNDRLGHLAGDAVLTAVAERLRDAVRQSDVPCRVGGDEFAVILPESGARDAEQLYRRIQFAVGSGAVGATERVRLSAGIAELRSDDDSVSVFQRADEALYRAKEGGKGQVFLADGPPGGYALEPGK